MQNISVNSRDISPTKIVCVGRNFADHIVELGNEVPEEMVIFVKPNSSITSVLPFFHTEPLHYEGELCFLYEDGKFSAIAFGLDLTKRELQHKLKEKGLPWERAKAFNGSALFSAFVDIPDSIKDLTFELEINNKLTQLGNVNLMIHKPADILAEILSFMDLNDGDIVMTGTPKGVGLVKQGDVFKARIKDAGKVVVSAEWQAK